MKATLIRTKRFSSPTVLTNETHVLGATVKEWDDALTGNMEKTLAEVKRRSQPGASKRDVKKAKSFDLASFAGKRAHNL